MNPWTVLEGIVDRLGFAVDQQDEELLRELKEDFDLEYNKVISELEIERRKSLSCPHCHYQMDLGNNHNLVCSTCGHSEGLKDGR